MAKAAVIAPVGAQPKARVKTEGAANSVADVKARAAKMRGQGLISDKQHKSLIAKADKVSAALGGGTGQLPDAK